MPKATNLRAIRESRLLSQAELAERSGVPQPTISKIERGRAAQYGTIRKLAAALRIRATALVDAPAPEVGHEH